MTRAIGLGIAAVAILIGLVVAAAWMRARIAPVSELRSRAPHRTALMTQRQAEAARASRAYGIDQRWVPYGRISPLLRRAVLTAEDDAFFAHGGLDWNEIQASARRNLEERKIVRGGSTITQQLAKNLFLGDARTPTRKLAELFVALRLEKALSKRRIFELYLNLIEWGDGIFGVEAAAQRWFHVPASALNARQAALLAAVIINPRRYSPANPNRRIEKRVRMIAQRMRRRGYLDDTQYRLAIGAPAPVDSERRAFTDWFFGAARDTAAPAEVPESAPSPAESTASDSALSSPTPP